MVDIPRTIDEPPYFLLWRVDDLALSMVGLLVGIFLDHLLLWWAVGIAISLAYRRYREGRPELYALHALYWIGLWPDRGFSMRSPLVRVLLA